MAFPQGERIGVVGENGAGKSTLLKALAGRLHGYEGDIWLRGELLRSRLPAARAEIGFLPEKLLGWQWMTVREHLDFLSSVYPGWDQGYAEELLERLELAGRFSLGALSKGMAVKLSFVAAEAYRPKLLLLDEPTSGVDPVMRRQLIALIRERVPKGGDRSVLFSTHILEDVEEAAERLVVLRSGRIAGDVNLMELKKRHPGTRLSAQLHELLSEGSSDDR